MKCFSSRMTKDGIKIDSVSTVIDETSESEKYFEKGASLSMLSSQNQAKLMRGESIDSKQLCADLDFKASDV